MPEYFEMLSSQQVPSETKPVVVPSSVERAMSIQFGRAISGFLCCALYDTHIQCLVGVVYRESRGRFRDGATIRTSTLISHFSEEGYDIFQTVNGSIYVVCEWAPAGASPRFEGVRH